MAAREEPETVVQPGRESLYPKGRGAGRGKLDGQRNAVEAHREPYCSSRAAVPRYRDN